MMEWGTRLSVAGMLCALSACSGGGGSTGAGSPSAAPPPASAPANSNITDLRVSQTFSSDAATTSVVLSTPAGIVASSTGAYDPVSVSYNAGTKSYTVTAGSSSQLFDPTSAQASSVPGESRYRLSGQALTLVTTPYYGSGTSNRYVGMGYWQRNTVADGSQRTQFSIFSYGLRTDAAAIPTSGSAHWNTDVFGLLTTPGQELRTIQGRGGLDVDFARASFLASGTVDEFNFITGGGRVGSLNVVAGGRVTSAGLVGDLSYSGGQAGLVAGTFRGLFYGPAADEIGASFVATGPGGVLSGAMTGQRDASAPGQTISLLNVRESLRLFSTSALFFTQQVAGHSDYADVKASASNGLVVIDPQGVTTFAPTAYGYTPLAADIVSDGPANFTTYRSTVQGAPVEVSFYKLGSGNSELQLTYLSLATWKQTKADRALAVDFTNVERYFQPYGIATPSGLLAARTGSASFSGVAYGAAASVSGTQYDISGGADFVVDFTNARYSGALALTGRSPNGSSRDLGKATFNGTLYQGAFTRTNIDGTLDGMIAPIFYGPAAQEVGAPFYFATGSRSDPATLQVTGVALAKQR
ncbi:transferrin-binding protein-like solute binding protein [uncultured Sphingomonas sp.]|uniref:transferrin-binding protein-like solute binding protein n=1 Tax=uncultured Sphingomonas sp. TaxID=158754 RepID=UPI0025E13024|nr:transferrin-binding protein-like solute binding protein [uncultured Sphingomonas sp.]